MKKFAILLLALALVFSFAACNNDADTPDVGGDTPEVQAATITIAAAASLEPAFTGALIPMFNETYPQITVEGAYDASGKLQTQIEAGLAADIFMSAATKQMNALVEGGYINAADVVELLQNKVVLIEGVGLPSGVTGFADIANAEIIAIGDPASVPVGQYAEEIFANLGILDAVLAKASLGTNVTEVLNWVGEGSAQVGVVYATDAATMPQKVAVIAEAPEGSLATPVIYPIAMLAGSANAEAAALFVQFLQSDEAIAVFESYGFSSNL
ncbi:MAG: molybdate ABC transporter substrate-binding protein [Clostridia bacterium]|nr:molybdate ABC transporter substrate-binding protein [Clostridia bacterium]